MRLITPREMFDLDFSPGKPLESVHVDGEGYFAPHEVCELQKLARSGIVPEKMMLSRRALFGLGGLGLAALLLRPDLADAANRTAWTAGNGVGFTWTTAQANAGTLATGNSVLDSTDVTNQSALDLFADLSHSLTLASSTIAAGANIAYWLCALNQDGTTYGDNHLTTTPAAVTPSFFPIAVINCFAAAAQTTIVGNCTGLVMPPGTFRWGTQNNCGFTLTGATIKYRTYNTNLNN